MTKAEIRLKYKTLRKQMSPFNLDKLSTLVCEKAMATFQLENKIVSLFLPIEKLYEINTYTILEQAKSFGAQIVVPKTNFETLDMKHVLFESKDQLEMNQKGIPEPKFGKSIAASKIDIVFVPLLTINSNGYRVGYGKGFYDRFLSKCNPNCIFIGLHLFEEFDHIEDLDPNDVPLHVCITPKQIIWFDKK
jgi:5-formyltetrahydrofolate cyclo-ligase